MAVNTQKLLPGSAGGALAIRYSKKTIAAPADKTKGGSLSKEILQMKTKIIRLQGEFAKNTKASQKAEETNRKKSEKEKSSKREKKFEQRGGIKGVDLPNVISKLPGGSIVDTIKRFLGFTLLGWLVGKYDKLMPQLEKFISVAKPVFDGIVSFTGSLFKGVYGFVEAGYKAYDKVSATIKQIGGENAEKTFNDFSSHLNKLLNGTLLMSMLIASTAPGRPGRMPGGKPGPGGGYTKPNQRLQSYLGRNNQTKLIERRYGNDAARMYEARRAQGGSHARALADVRGRFQPTSSPLGSLGGTNRGSGVFKRGLAKTPQRAATKMFGKAAGKTVSKLGGRIPIVGPLIDFGIRTLIYKEPLGKAAAGAVGMGVGQALGGWLGGAIGGIIGSVVPIIGTMLVGAAGATVGSLIGGVIGDLLGVALYDFVAGSNNKGKATGQARGGTIGNRRPRRTSTGPGPSRRRIQPQPTKPGKDIGGRRKIEEFYGKDTPRDSIQTRGETIVKSLEKTSKEVKKLPLDWVASIGGAYIDMTMGQKPDKKLASDVGKSFGIFIDSAINAEVAATTGQITKALVGMANGGSIPTNSAERGKIAKEAAKNIEQRLQTIFDQSSTIALRNFKEQYSTLGVGGFPGGGGGDGEGGGGAGGYAEGEENFVSSKDVYDYIRSKGLSHNHAMGMLANIQAESSFNAGAIGDNGTSGGLFQHHAERFSGMVAYAGKDWAKNWKRQVDYALREDAGKQYANKDFKNAADASAWFTLNFERPSNKEQKARNRIDNLSNFGSDGSWKGSPGAGAARGPSQVEALSKGFRTGLRTGPEGRIGAGTEYHVDGRFMYNLPLKDKIAMLDSMASAHAEEGYVMEFSGSGVAGMRWSPGMSMREKEEFAKKILASHHESRHPWQAFDYFIVKRSAKDRWDKSAEGANIMAPIIKDGTYEYQEGGGAGRFLIIRDKNGNEVMKILHGDTGVPKPKQLGKVFKMNELTEAQRQALAQGNDPKSTPTQRSANVTQALSQKGAIPFNFNGQKFFFRVNADGSVEAFRTKGPLGFLVQEPIDISGNKNKALRQAINEKVQTMYGKPKPPTPGPGGKGYGGNMQKGGILGPYSSLNSIKEDTSYNKEMVVMYREKIVMVPSQQY